MYQSVQTDIEDATPANASGAPKERYRRALIGVVMIGVLILGSVALMTYLNGVPSDPAAEKARMERNAYLSAISERRVALRRARLLDFVSFFPDSARAPAAKAQADVLSRTEAKDWARISDIMFDTQKPVEQKLAEMEAYERRWSPELLGGRADEIKQFKSGVMIDPDVLPDREMDIGPTNGGGDGDEMAGGSSSTPFGYQQPGSRNTGLRSGSQSRGGMIVEEARTVRNSTPQYPKRALRRGVEGVVELRLFINARGRVDTTEMVRADAEKYQSDFIRAAERAALRTRFSPRTENGRAVATRIDKTYRFQISD